ncbi:MAG: hypothetical protein GF417_00595, partial [Candidatus Latescibacteria bacterium]|nr:hypothetical protein [bacterium]MBD3422925.1 hypothetical protein [Candidatus Latescibacterota bacterium]
MKRAILLLLAIVVTCSTPLRAGEPETGAKITPDVIEELKGSLEGDPAMKALINAVSNNDLKELTSDNQFHREHDDLFNYRIDTSGITDQKRSGRCWLFAGFNMMRPGV